MAKRKSAPRIALVAVLVLVAVVARIVYVNATAIPSYPVVHYSMGEWVDLDGAFHMTSSNENTQGYSVRVSSAEKMSRNEYIERYGTDPSKVIEGLDADSVIAITLDVRNEGNSDGAMLIFETKLIPDRKNEYFIRDKELWPEKETVLAGTLCMYLSIQENSEYTTVIPYKTNVIDQDGYSQYERDITDTSFELVLSSAPVRKVVDIDL